MRTCDDCKWCRETQKGYLCIRHAPIVMPNPKFEKGRDEEVTLTILPLAVGPCGDFEVEDEK